MQVLSHFFTILSGRGVHVYDAYMRAWRWVRGVNLFSYGDYPACCDLACHCLRGYLGSFKTELVGIYSTALKTMVYPGAPNEALIKRYCIMDHCCQVLGGIFALATRCGTNSSS